MHANGVHAAFDCPCVRSGNAKDDESKEDVCVGLTPGGHVLEATGAVTHRDEHSKHLQRKLPEWITEQALYTTIENSIEASPGEYACVTRLNFASVVSIKLIHFLRFLLYSCSQSASPYSNSARSRARVCA